MSALVTFDVPYSVWLDALDPDASGMQAELADEGLPAPVYVKRGKGAAQRYVDAPGDVALELAEYISSRASMLLSQGVQDPYDVDERRTRDAYRNAIKTADRIRALVKSAR